MKKQYDLKAQLERELENVKLTEAIKDNIRNDCYQRMGRNGESRYKMIMKVAVFGIMLLVGMSGTAFAISNVEGFKQFMDEGKQGKVGQYIQTINRQDMEGDVRLVVEEAIMDHYSSLLVFSFINEGAERWPEGVEAGTFGSEWSSSWGWGKPILSEDGRRLTYYVEGSSNKDITRQNTLELKAQNLIHIREYDVAIDIPVGILYEDYGASLNLEDYEFELTKEPTLKLNQLLKRQRRLAKGEKMILDKEEGVSLEYVGMIEGETGEGSIDTTRGFTIFTRNDSYKLWTETNQDYVIGYVSEVTDVRTGQVYNHTGVSIEHDGLLSGALCASQFEGVEGAKQIPYLRATKMTYEVQEVISKEKWKVAFSIEEAPTLRNTTSKLKIEDGEEYTLIEDIIVSPLGVNIKMSGSETFGKPIEPSGDSLQDKIQVAVVTIDGEVIPLRPGGGSYFDEKGKRKGINRYRLYDEEGNTDFLDIDQIKGVMVNETLCEVQ